MKIALHLNEKMFKHASVWIPECKAYCEENGHECDVISCYDSDIIEKLRGYDAVLWTMQNYVKADIMEARSILYSAKQMGLKIFPDYNTSWHFDDKIAETYLLQAVNAPLPKSWVFYLEDECVNFLENEAKYPLVAKLRCGSGANNVVLLHNVKEAKKYAKAMFRDGGFSPAPKALYKAYSKAQSSNSLSVMINRIKKIPDFMRTLSNAKKMAREANYCYFQEYIENDGFDIKVVVVGDKLIPYFRNARKGDWRASGGGDKVFDHERVTEQVIKTSFDVYDKCGFQVIGFDYVVDKNTGEGIIIEISYGTNYGDLTLVGGYFDRDCKWHEDKNLSAPKEIIDYVLKN